MHILVWKSYSEIEVYCAETIEQLDEIRNIIVNSVIGFDRLNEESKKVIALYDMLDNFNLKVDIVKKKKKRKLLHDLYLLNCFDNRFETFEFTKVIY